MSFLNSEALLDLLCEEKLMTDTAATREPKCNGPVGLGAKRPTTGSADIEIKNPFITPKQL